MGRSIEDLSVRLLGFLSLPSAITTGRRSSFPACGHPALGFGLSQVSRVRPLRTNGHERTGTNCPSRSTDRPTHGSPGAESAHGFRYQQCRPGEDDGKQYRSPSCAELARLRVDRSLLRDATRRCARVLLTSLQRVEATDALPIRVRVRCYESPRTGSLSEVLHRPCRDMKVRHGEARQPI